MQLSLEAVNDMYNTKGLKAWQSGRWTPPGYYSRTQFVEIKAATEAGEKIEFADKDGIPHIAPGSMATQTDGREATV
jgi:hypothetical protein